MLEKLAAIEERYENINQMLMEVGSDYQRAAELGIERAEMEPVVLKARQYRQARARLDEARALQGEEDEELRLMAEAEIDELGPQIAELENEIKTLLIPKDPRDQRNVIMEIRAGTGGDEASLFAADLFRMYSRYAERLRWEIDVMSASEIGIGGYKEIIFNVKGRGAYSRLKIRVGRAPCAARAGHRILGSHPHLHRHSRRVGRSG